MWVENLNRFCSRILSIVIFLVRMWVENVGNQNLRNGRCHPPCEDVSWKGCECEYCDDENVILLVRMWVEKMAGWFLFPLSIRHPPCEDVSWKINWCAFPRGGACHPPCEDVSWKRNVWKYRIHYGTSSSLWGCELKTCCGSVGNAMSGHPPCEDVSWKLAHTMNLICPLCHPPCEDVSWKTDLISIM